ncbi:TetR/AcrR family transcriptional regulator [Vallitalea guaymasensis]|uniref:TetR/AcrR family transcriptional regulator n=1 Tax=Vallitalea guaymasensis TaxID=1185412 RepID=UPI0023578E1C|nr:TetR/AcrR family transcriptional regulator [Vallitalea guaymasensis]
MSVQDTSLNPKITESAIKEFLEYGYLNASVKRICENAGVTTGALYKRYKGKEDLFDSIIEPIYDKLEKLSDNRISNTLKILESKELEKFWSNPIETYKYQINYLYDHYEGMRLLLCSSEGTKHSGFLHGFVTKITNLTYEIIEEIYKRGLSCSLMDKDTLHMLLTAYWTTIFESIIHSDSREVALKKSETIAVFFNWSKVFGF